MKFVDKYVTPFLKKTPFGYLIEEREWTLPIAIYSGDNVVIAMKKTHWHWYDTWKSYGRRCAREARIFNADRWRFATKEEVANWNERTETIPLLVLKDPNLMDASKFKADEIDAGKIFVK